MTRTRQPPRSTTVQLRTLIALISWLGLTTTQLQSLLRDHGVGALPELPRAAIGDFVSAALTLARQTPTP